MPSWTRWIANCRLILSLKVVVLVVALINLAILSLLLFVIHSGALVIGRPYQVICQLLHSLLLPIIVQQGRISGETVFRLVFHSTNPSLSTTNPRRLFLFARWARCVCLQCLHYVLYCAIENLPSRHQTQALKVRRQSYQITGFVHSTLRDYK